MMMISESCCRQEAIAWEVNVKQIIAAHGRTCGTRELENMDGISGSTKSELISSFFSHGGGYWTDSSCAWQ
jgi:hypothetical protein